MAKVHPLAAKVFEAHIRQLQRLVEGHGVRGVRKMYSNAKADLQSRLLKVGPASKGAEATSLRAMLAQVDGVVSIMGKDLHKHLSDTSSTVARLGARHGVDEFKRLSKAFKGTTPVLNLDKAAVFEGMVKDVDTSLLRRHQRISQTWSNRAIDAMEAQLSVSAMTGKSLHETVNSIMGTGKVFERERWKAERIVRTECAYSHGAAKHRAMKEMLDDEPDMLKRLLATFDDRTGDDSFLVHGQTVPVELPFTWKHKVAGAWVEEQYMFPPNRPNDREVVVPWDPTWDDEEGESALPKDELRSAEPTAWRKEAGIKIPPGHHPGESYDEDIREETRAQIRRARKKAKLEEVEFEDDEDDDEDED